MANLTTVLNSPQPAVWTQGTVSGGMTSQLPVSGVMTSVEARNAAETAADNLPPGAREVYGVEDSQPPTGQGFNGLLTVAAGGLLGGALGGPAGAAVGAFLAYQQLRYTP